MGKRTFVKRGWPRNLTEQACRLPNGCLFWYGRRVTKGNYGQVRREGKDIPVHVAAYEWFVGPIPEGYEVDHLCHDPDVCKLGDRCPHRRCVEPSHLKAVTPRENGLRSNAPHAINARKTHCIRGHEFTPENTYVDPKGHRQCRECRPTWVPRLWHDRVCDGCHGQIPADKRADTRYCSANCRVLHWKHTHPEAMRAMRRRESEKARLR